MESHSDYRGMLSARARLHAEASALVNAADAASWITDSKSTKFQEHARLTAAIAQADADIAAEEVRREHDRTSPAIDMHGRDIEYGLSGASARHATGEPRDQALAVAQSQPFAGRHHAELFGKPTAAADEGWKGFDDFRATVHGGRADPRVVAATSMGGAVGSDGGFLIPGQFTAELLDASLEDEVVRPLARVYPMTQGNERKIAGFDGRDHGDDLHGLRGVWLEESGTSTRQKAKTRLLRLIAHKLGIYAQASNELIADGMTFEELLGQAMREAIGFDLDEAFLNGNGVAKPLGVLNDPATITIAKEIGQGADTVSYDNLKNMFARMHPAGRRRAVWVANSTAIPELLGLSLVIGTGGSAVPVMSEGSDGSFRILTRPVIFTEKVPALGDRGDISLVDFSQYAIGMRKEAVLDRSNGPGWFEDEGSYRMILRVDGRGRWAAPLAPRNGATLSWAVTLIDR